ncbi:MAG TPA: dolichyl-phosphate beta-glucosyltransferase [Bryobacteraceae bacterium]|nr:dolichyl-phosphate beta-glucosyltransferase [Bryobacteraceae bacterium]
MTPSISIVIPAYNEERRLPATLERIHAYLDSGNWAFREVLVVDDGSTDKTAEVAASFPGTRLLRNPGNRGKGYSVRHGMLEARAEWVLLSDADLSTPIEELDKLWQAAQASGAQIAIGSRALDRSLVGVHQPFLREAVGRLFNLAMRLITGLPFRDTQCGFKLFAAPIAREVFSRQTLEGFGFDVEVLVLARELGYRAIEVPVRWNDALGTKVSITRGLAAFLDPLRVAYNVHTGKYRR